jgi:copper resistance protein C
MTPRTLPSRLRAVVAVAAISLTFAPCAAAHSELVSSSPAAGETVVGSPPTITATYSETLDPDGSSLILVDPGGTDVAHGGVASGAGDTKDMSIDPVPQLAPGVYMVKSTTKSAEDGDVDRTTWQFRVVAPPPSPTTATTPGASAAATSSATATTTPTPVVSPSPTAAPGPSSGGGSDVVLPIIVALAIVTLVGAVLLTRGRRPGPGA